MIPESLKERLKPYGPRFIKVQAPEQGNSSSGKRAVEHGFQINPYALDDPEIEDWVKAGGNYGILLGKGLIGIDADSLELFEIFPETFTVQSGSGRGGHLYYRSDVVENGTIFDEDGKNIGNVQAHFKYLVGPNSKHWLGGTYEIIEDVPIEWLSRTNLEKIVKKSQYNLQWAGAARKDAEDAAKDENELVGVEIPIEDLVDLNELKRIGKGEFQGSHPIHGSTTGQNFNVNTDLNCWHCFRCNSGGGPLSWLAVREGLIGCSEAKKGALRGELFLEALDIARGLGYPIKEIGIPKTLPTEALKYFGKRMNFIPKRLADEILDKKYVYVLGSNVFMYDPDMGIYRDRGEAPIYRLIYRKLGEAYRDYHAREVLKIVKFETKIDEAKELNPELHAVENGILNVLTGELKPFTPDEFITTKLPVKYDPKASPEIIEGFVSNTVHPEDRDTLQEFAGYCLLKDHRFRKGCVLHGPTQSGKTTFTEALRKLLGGPENVASTQLHDIIANRFAAASLYGKLGNFAPELDEREVKYTGKIKALTGGDTFTAEFKGRDSFQFISYAKQLYNCNQLPKISPKENVAFFNRFELIRFPNQFLGDRADPEILHKLTTPEVLSGMLNWMLEGLRRLVERGGFKVRMGLEEMRERYLVTSDPIERFIKTQIVRDGKHVLPKDRAYEALRRYCQRYGAFVPSKRALGAAMKEEGLFEVRVTDEKGDRHRCWRGIKANGAYSLVEEDGKYYSRLCVKEDRGI